MKKNKKLKKKGRKPIAKVYNKENIADLTIDDCLIAHIPITIEKIDSYNIKNNIKNIDNINNNITKKETNISSKLFNTPNKDNKENNDEYNKTTLLNQIDTLQNHIKILEKTIISNNETINYNYSSINIHNNIKQNSNLVCWWCCHCFNNTPIYLPERKLDNHYYMYGYFCSFNCAMAYNVDLNDYKIWERSSHLNQLYYKLNNKYKKIKPAPSKYSLDIFGGKLSIDIFRKKFLNTNIDYRLIIPPLKSIIPIIEEKQINNNNDNNNSNFNKLTESLVLKRKKPISTLNNSIEKAMNLQLLG